MATAYDLQTAVQHDYGHWLELARARVGPGAVLLGPSAAWAHGCTLADPGDDIHVAVGRRAWPRSRDGIVPHRVELPVDTVRAVPHWGLATTPTRTGIDVARGVGLAGVTEAGRVAWVDAVLHQTRTPASAARSAAMSTTDLAGMTTARRVVHLARDGAESVKETELRLLLRRLGFPEPDLQYEVFDPNRRFVARLDVAWQYRRVGVEYDGAGHRQPAQHSRDLDRHNRLRACGWTVFQIDAWSLARPTRWADQLRKALA